MKKKKLRTQLKAKSNKQREVRMSLQTLQAAKNDRLQRFGAWMPAMISQINACKRQFHKLPLGPLGRRHILSIKYSTVYKLSICFFFLVDGTLYLHF